MQFLALLGLLVAASTASPVAFSAADALSKRLINPDTVNVLTAEQLTTQRNLLLQAQSETAREAILSTLR